MHSGQWSVVSGQWECIHGKLKNRKWMGNFKGQHKNLVALALSKQLTYITHVLYMHMYILLQNQSTSWKTNITV